MDSVMGKQNKLVSQNNQGENRYRNKNNTKIRTTEKKKVKKTRINWNFALEMTDRLIASLYFYSRQIYFCMAKVN
jgi:hypothetical protein